VGPEPAGGENRQGHEDAGQQQAHDLEAGGFAEDLEDVAAGAIDADGYAG